MTSDAQGTSLVGGTALEPLFDPAAVEISSFKGTILSNFFAAHVEWRGKAYASTEHAYQAAKTEDEIAHEAIRTAPTPRDAKRLGRSLSAALLRPDWDDVKLGVMRELIRLKFAPGGRLAEALVRTYPAKLVEGNSHGDRFWGVSGGHGQNHLGQILMEHRQTLRAYALRKRKE